ncbi:MAG: RlmE family RNA methyltransferase [Nanoarchaeota archaeon]|nr:RlmE family RNA methyltransferase [Nanoarchaeota archaeon]
MKDFYTRKSREEGYYARSAYKLKQINKKYQLIRKKDKVLDLGCSPGGWIQATLEIIGEQGFIVGVDITPVRKIKAKNFKFIKEDVNEAKIEGKFNVVLSDTAPKTTGIQDLDHERSYDLAKTALKIAKEHLERKGNFLCKVFQGKYYPEFLKNVKENFEFVKTVKPKASKKQSKEMYVIGKCMKPKKE